MREINVHLLAYQLVMFAHSWALKHWALRERYALAEYVSEGIKILIDPFLTAKGRRVLQAMSVRTGAFGSEGLKAGARAKAAKGRSTAGKKRSR